MISEITGNANQKSHGKEVEEANSQIETAETVWKEPMDLLKKGIKGKNFKVSASNAIWKRLDCLFKCAEWEK